MKKYLGLALAVFMLLAPVAQGGLLQLNFAGEIVANFPDDGTDLDGFFSGSFLLDSNAPDVRPQADNADYATAVVDGSLMWGQNEYFLAPSFLDGVFVLNNNDILHDLFSVLAGLEDQDGNAIIFSLVLRDSSENVFSSDAFPGSLSLSDFDAFDPLDPNGTNAVYLGPDSVTNQQGGFSFLELVAVPAPATVWLMVFAGLIWLRKRQ